MNAPLVFDLYKPEKTRENQKYPALFLLHGMGSNEKDLPSLVKGFEQKMFIFSLRGPIFQPPGYAFFSMHELGKPDRDSFENTMKLLDQFLDFACSKYPVDPGRIFLLGFSQGAIMSMSYGMKNLNRVKGIIALSGYVPDFLMEECGKSSLKQINLYISHGYEDPVLPYEWGKQSAEFLKERGAEVSFHPYHAGHWVSEENFNDLRNWLEDKLK